jgi:hypothetical protein
MKELTILESGVPLSPELINKFQSDYAIAFPQYLVCFFLKYNGSEVKESSFKDKYVINNILPLLLGRNASVELILPALRNPSEGIRREDLIPFAIDPGGRPFYVSINDKDRGVYIDRMSTGHPMPILKISEDFDEFIDGLTE